MECHLDDGTTLGLADNYAVAAKSKVWRHGSAGKPVAVFNVHL